MTARVCVVCFDNICRPGDTDCRLRRRPRQRPATNRWE
jgi:hypothetical protein